MRFSADGPSIPNELLYARDEGDVIFFCGAGVSRAEAGGPTFKELCERVVKDLGSARDSPARKLLALSEAIQDPPLGVGGLPPADRVFALLEQEFDPTDVRASVARAVQPIANPGLKPHQSLADLSKVPSGAARLITTNFDRVFQLACPTLNVVLPPELPDPHRTDGLEGIIHLHGIVAPDYSSAAPGEFVLSSADFGRAYLADGWATAFIQALIERYKVVFVGYSADDPPVQYLLEALSRSTPADRLYAFHSGGADQAAALWRHKGVTAIPFDGYSTLWSTLAAWAERARDPAVWRASIRDKALAGPAGLKPYERGQVAHLVSSDVGAREFAQADAPPPAEWLCVFDPQIRRLSEVRSDQLSDGQTTAFQAYGLDSDEKPDTGDVWPRNSLSADGWSALSILPNEKLAPQLLEGISLRGLLSTSAPLTPRLESLAFWVRRVAGDGVTAWWAAGQPELHPGLVRLLRDGGQEIQVEVVRDAWRLLFSARQWAGRSDLRPYRLQHIVAKEGWSTWALRELLALEEPYITVDRASAGPPLGTSVALTQIIRKDVAYPGHLPELAVPQELLPRYIRSLRYQLESAEPLEMEGSNFFYPMLRPIVPYDDPGSRFSNRADDLPAKAVHMAQQMARWASIDSRSARIEMQAWPSSDDAIFRLLHVWCAGQPNLTSAEEAGSLLCGLSEDVFWDRYVQRDLLVAMEARWSELSADYRKQLESRLLEGPAIWDGASSEQFAIHRAYKILSRLFWLEQKQLKTDIDLHVERAALCQIVPDWSSEDAEDEVSRSTSRGGWVATNTEHGRLLEVPLKDLLDAASEASGRSRDVLVELRPFKGLAVSRPVKVLSALVRAGARGQAHRQFWSDFLWDDKRKEDRPRLRLLIAMRVLRLPQLVFRDNLSSFAEWLNRSGENLYRTNRSLYVEVWNRLVLEISISPDSASSGIVGDTRRDWMMAAINSPTGRLAVIMYDEFDWAGPQEPLISIEWKERAQTLLNLRGAPLEHATAVFGSRLNWLYYADPDWTNERLICPLDISPLSRASQATLECALQAGEQWTLPLAKRMRGILVEAVTGSTGLGTDHSLAIRLLSTWLSTDADGANLISDNDLREVLITSDEVFRLTILREFSRFAEDSNDWIIAVNFIKGVWPKQLLAKSPAASASLARLAMSSGDHMPQVTRAVLPLLTKTSESWAERTYLNSSQDDLIHRFPLEHLQLLHAVLSPDPNKWGYGADALIQQLSNVDAIREDPTLLKLSRLSAKN